MGKRKIADTGNTYKQDEQIKNLLPDLRKCANLYKKQDEEPRLEISKHIRAQHPDVLKPKDYAVVLACEGTVTLLPKPVALKNIFSDPKYNPWEQQTEPPTTDEVLTKKTLVESGSQSQPSTSKTHENSIRDENTTEKKESGPPQKNPRSNVFPSPAEMDDAAMQITDNPKNADTPHHREDAPGCSDTLHDTSGSEVPTEVIDMSSEDENEDEPHLTPERHIWAVNEQVFLVSQIEVMKYIECIDQILVNLCNLKRDILNDDISLTAIERNLQEFVGGFEK